MIDAVNYIPKFRNEAHFEKHFKEVAPFYGCAYFKIPDPIPFFKSSGRRGTPLAHRRPFDGMLATPMKNFAIELKFQYNGLEDHQKESLCRIREMNGMAYVVRYVNLAKRFEFRVEIETGDRVFVAERLEEVFEYLKTAREGRTKKE